MAKASRAKSSAVETAAVAAPVETGAKTYVVTEKAPPRVAGKRVKAGDSITLTDDQARAELLALHIRPEAVEAPASNDA
jgi:propanediol dehydratase small subunit